MCDCSLEVNPNLLVVIPSDGTTVCTGCGLVLDDLYFADLPYVPRHCFSARYKRIFHSNERMALFTQTSPETPEDAYDLIEEEWFAGCMEDKYPCASQLTQHHIYEICRSVSLNEEQKNTFRSTKYKRNRPINLKKYAERWIEIKSKLQGEPVVNPDPECVLQLKRYFALLQIPFDTLIYKHIRNNFINYNLVYTIGLELLQYEYYKPFFPPPTGKKVLTKLCDLMWQMFKFLNWPPTPTILQYSSTVDKALQPGHLRFFGT